MTGVARSTRAARNVSSTALTVPRVLCCSPGRDDVRYDPIPCRFQCRRYARQIVRRDIGIGDDAAVRRGGNLAHHVAQLRQQARADANVIDGGVLAGMVTVTVFILRIVTALAGARNRWSERQQKIDRSGWGKYNLRLMSIQEKFMTLRTWYCCRKLYFPNRSVNLLLPLRPTVSRASEGRYNPQDENRNRDHSGKAPPPSMTFASARACWRNWGDMVRQVAPAPNCCVVTDSNVAPHYLSRVTAALEAAGYRVVSHIILPATAQDPGNRQRRARHVPCRTRGAGHGRSSRWVAAWSAISPVT